MNNLTLPNQMPDQRAATVETVSDQGTHNEAMSPPTTPIPKSGFVSRPISPPSKTSKPNTKTSTPLPAPAAPPSPPPTVTIKSRSGRILNKPKPFTGLVLGDEYDRVEKEEFVKDREALLKKGWEEDDILVKLGKRIVKKDGGEVEVGAQADDGKAVAETGVEGGNELGKEENVDMDKESDKTEEVKLEATPIKKRKRTLGSPIDLIAAQQLIDEGLEESSETPAAPSFKKSKTKPKPQPIVIPTGTPSSERESSNQPTASNTESIKESPTKSTKRGSKAKKESYKATTKTSASANKRGSTSKGRKGEIKSIHTPKKYVLT